MKFRTSAYLKIEIIATVLGLTSLNAFALDLDWGGQFRAEALYVNPYTMDSGDAASSVDPARMSGGSPTGYYIPAGGSKKAQFQTLFLRLKPNIHVNDNVVLKSEWWLGNPITGFYGSGMPNTVEGQAYSTTYSTGSSITAQRFYAEIYSDFGTLQVGRAPLNWGLGAVYHSGDGLFDRYQSTGDTFRLISKFGNFTVSPSFTKFSYGTALGGSAAFPSVTPPPTGGSGLSEYSLGLNYESPTEFFEGGVQLVRRLTGPNSSAILINNSSGDMGVTLWDIYLKKSISRLDLALEVPFFGGKLLGKNYSGFALVAEAKYRLSDKWNLKLNAGKVPGQESFSGSGSNPNPEKWTMVYLNPNYRLGFMMFGMQLRNLSANPANGSATTPNSIYDNPITNANYAALSASYKPSKWEWHTALMTASANQSAKSGQYYLNTWTRKIELATTDQAKGLGTEFDLGTTYHWDDYTQFGFDLAYYAPGDFYAFSNTATPNKTSSILGARLSLGIQF